MKQLTSHQRRGFTLLELMLALALIAIIITIGIRRYQFYERQKDIAAVQENVSLLFSAFDAYYHTNCKTTNQPSPFPQYPPISALNVHLLYSRLASAANYSISSTPMGNTRLTGKPIYSLSVSVTLTVPPASMSFYQTLLNATTAIAVDASHIQLTWTRLPTYTVLGISSNLQTAEEQLRQFKEVAGSNIGNTDVSCAY